VLRVASDLKKLHRVTHRRGGTAVAKQVGALQVEARYIRGRGSPELYFF